MNRSTKFFSSFFSFFLFFAVFFPISSLAADNVDIVLSYNPDPILSGQEAVFTLSYRSLGSGNACPNPTLEMTLADQASYVDSTANGMHTGEASGGIVSWDLPTIPPPSSQPASVSVTTEIEANLPDNTPLVLDVLMTGKNGSTCYTGTFVPPVNPTAVFVISKEASRQIVQPGQQINYTLELSNTGNLDASNVSITDTLPVDTNFISASDSGIYTPGNPATVTWTIANLGIDTTTFATVVVEVIDPTSTGTIIVNSVEASAPDVETVTATASTEVASKPVLEVEKTAQDTVLTGGEIHYTIQYKNSGDTTATNAILVDNYSPLIVAVTGVSGGGVVNQGARTITWTIADLDPGESGEFVYSVVIADGLTDADIIENTAVLDADNADTVQDTHEAYVIIPLPDLLITKTGPGEAVAGSSIDYQIDYSNVGAASSINTIIEDHLPFNCIDVTASSGGIYDSVNHNVTWLIGNLDVGQSGTVSINCGLDSPIANGTELTNTASISSENGSPRTSQVVTVISSQPLLTLTKSGAPNPVLPGGILVYHYKLTNTGNANATNIHIEDHLDQNIDYINDTATGLYDPAEHKVRWDIDQLNVGDVLNIYMETMVDIALIGDVSLFNNATAKSDETNSVGAQDEIQVRTAPELTLSKSADKNLVEPDGLITYTLSYNNIGNAEANNVILSDTLPLHTQYVSSSFGGVENAGVVTWDLGVLPPLSSVGEIILTVRVDTPLANNTLLHNNAFLESDETQPVSGHADVLVSSNPIIELYKEADRSTVEVGEKITYALAYANEGNANATNVVLQDPLPPGTSYVTSSGGGQLNNGIVEWPPIDLNVSSSGAHFLTVLVDGSFSNGDIIHNAASMVSDQTSPVSAIAEVTVNHIPILEITKTASKFIASPGDEITYFITYKNTGNAFATNLVLEDQIPENMSFVGATGNYSFSGGIVTWTTNELAIGQEGIVTLTISINSSLSDGTVITNYANLDSSETSPVIDFATIVIQNVPVISLEKTADSEFVEAGSQVVFTLHYENTGTAAATGVVLSDELPGNTSFISATGGGVYDPVSRVVTWTDPSLDIGAIGQVQLTLLVDDTTPTNTLITNTASMHGDNFQPILASDSITVERTPLLSLEKSADVDFVEPAQQITYTLNFSNNGNSTSQNLFLVDVIPAETEFISADGGGVLVDGYVLWNFASLASGESGSVSLVVEVDPLATRNTSSINGSIIYNVAALHSADANTAVDSLETPVQILANLELSKTANLDFVEAGEQVIFTLDYTNTGNATADNVVLEDRIPANTTFVDATGGGVLTGDTVTWTDPGLEVGATGTVHLILEVNNTTPDNTEILNIATIDSDDTTPKSAIATILVKRSPLLMLEKLADKEYVGPDELITYTLEYSNIGNSTAVDVVLEDPVPADTSFESASSGGTLVNGIVVWNFPQLAVGATGSLTMTVRVDSTAPIDLIVTDGSIIHNVATLDSSNAYAVSAEDDVIVKISPVLTLSKTASSEFIQAGQEITYTMTYQNTGNGSANNLLLEDAIPNNTSYVSSSSNGVFSNGKVVWTLVELTSGAQGTVSLTVRVNDTTPEDTSILNTASITSAETVPINDSVTVVVKGTPVLELSKTADVEFAEPGDFISFLLAYSNTGNETAVGIILEDPVPNNTTFISATGTGSLVGNKVVWNESNLISGGSASVSMTVQVNADAKLAIAGLNGTIIHNIATLDSSNAYAVSAEDTVIVQTFPILNLEKTADVEVASPGDLITYTLNYANTGNGSVLLPTLADTVPEDTSFIFASGGGVENNGVVTWNFLELAPGLSGSVTMTVQVDDPLSNSFNDVVIHNTATLDSAGQAPSVSDFADVLVRLTAIPNLVKTSDIQFAQPGEEITYTLEFSNTGNTAITNASLVDDIPTDTSFISASDAGVVQDGKVVWSFTNLAAGSEGTVSMIVRVNNGVPDDSVIHNNASLDSGDQAPPVSAEVEVIINAAPVLSLTKSPSDTLIFAGEEITYTLDYLNTGNATASNSILEEAIPANTTFVSASNGGNLIGGIVTWGLGNLLPGAGGSVTMTVMVNGSTPALTIIHNTATLGSSEVPPVEAQANVLVYALTLPAVLTIAMEGSPLTIEPGEDALFTVDYANVTGIIATNAKIIAMVPGNAAFLSASNGGTLQTNGEQSWVEWSVASLPANQVGNVSYSVRHVISESSGRRVSGARNLAGSLLARGLINADNANPADSAFALVKIEDSSPPPPPTSVPILDKFGLFLLTLVLAVIAVMKLSSREQKSFSS